MFELIALVATGTLTVGGFYQAREFVRRRLRYVTAIQKPTAPVIAGVGAAVVASPVLWVLPLVGAGTAVLFGVGVGAGVASGVRALRDGRALPPS